MRQAWRSSSSARPSPRPSHSAALSSTRASRHSCRSVNLVSTTEFRPCFDCSQRRPSSQPKRGSYQGASQGDLQGRTRGASSHLRAPWFNKSPRESVLRASCVGGCFSQRRRLAAGHRVAPRGFKPYNLQTFPDRAGPAPSASDSYSQRLTNRDMSNLSRPLRDWSSPRAMFQFESIVSSAASAILLALAIGVAYFVAARLGLVFMTKPGLAGFWPAAGVAVGALIALGPKARLPVAVAVVVATTLANVAIGRIASLSLIFGFVNAGQTLLTAWLVKRWFGREFKLEDIFQVLGFLAASAIGAAMAAAGAALAISLIQAAASTLELWRIWFASCLLGIVTMALGVLCCGVA